MPATRFGLSRPTYLMVLGFGIFGILPILLMLVFAGDHLALGVTYRSLFLSNRVADDSWYPIANAMRYLASHSPEGLYQATYFNENHQFLYSPLSFVFYRLTQWPPVLDWFSVPSLNRFSWGVLCGIAGLIIVLFNDFYRVLGIDAGPVPITERTARIVLPLLATVLFYPLMWGYWVGNIQTWLTFMFILSMLLWLRGYHGAVGLCLGLVSIFKPTMAPILLWALLRREYRVIVGYLAVIIPCAIASLILYGINIHLEYFQLMSYLSHRGESFTGSHSVNSLLNRAIFNGPNLVWDGTHSHVVFVPWVYYVSTATTLLFIALAVIGRPRSDPVSSWIDYGVALLCITLGSPVIYEHHLTFTLVLFMVAGLMLCASASPPRLLLVMLGIGYALVANFFDKITDLLASTHFNFLQSYRLFGCLFLLAVLFQLRAAASRSRRTPAARQPEQVRPLSPA